jgi:hypothetical protein
MFYGRGRAGTKGRGGGSGFGFRGMTPPSPYIGRGRGGLPRCGYSVRASLNPVDQSTPAKTINTGTTGRDEELDYLKYQAEVLKKQLEQIELRIDSLEAV